MPRESEFETINLVPLSAKQETAAVGKLEVQPLSEIELTNELRPKNGAKKKFPNSLTQQTECPDFCGYLSQTTTKHYFLPKRGPLFEVDKCEIWVTEQAKIFPTFLCNRVSTVTSGIRLYRSKNLKFFPMKSTSTSAVMRSGSVVTLFSFFVGALRWPHSCSIKEGNQRQKRLGWNFELSLSEELYRTLGVKKDETFWTLIENQSWPNQTKIYRTRRSSLPLFAQNFMQCNRPSSNVFYGPNSILANIKKPSSFPPISWFFDHF